MQAESLMELLWRHSLPERRGARGPKQALSVDAVVTAGIALADSEGYEKVSIRSVAAELGLRPMGLYTYIPSKDTLIMLMVDAVADEDAPIPAGADIRERLAAIAHNARAELLTHPWLLEVPPWRAVLGPGKIRRYERQLSALDGLGLSDVTMDRIIAALTEFATGNARMSVAAARAEQEMSDAQWWELHGPMLAEVMPADQFPLATRVGAAVGELYQAPGDPDGTFAYGLQKLIDGIDH